jgi:hypothetical protein
VSLAYVSLPGISAEESKLEKAALAITNDVLGFDTTNYDVSFESGFSMPFPGRSDPVISIGCVLVSDEGKIQLTYSFVNDQLEMLSVLDRSAQGAILPNNAILTATDFLSRYQKYTNDPLYDQLGAMLNNDHSNTNFTKTSPNATLEATIIGDSTRFKWSYNVTGAVAPFKYVTIHIENGSLTSFVDNWQPYPVGNTVINLTEEDAITIALETVRNHTWSQNIDASSLAVENFNASNVRWTFLTFDNSFSVLNAHSNDPLEIYPVWRIAIALDKWYGYMYGVEVDVWADTGTVRLVHEAWSSIRPDDYLNLPSPSPNPSIEPSPNPSSGSQSSSGSSSGVLSDPKISVKSVPNEAQSGVVSEPTAIADHEVDDMGRVDVNAPLDIPLLVVAVISGVMVVVVVCVYLALRKRGHP